MSRATRSIGCPTRLGPQAEGDGVLQALGAVRTLSTTVLHILPQMRPVETISDLGQGLVWAQMPSPYPIVMCFKDMWHQGMRENELSPGGTCQFLRVTVVEKTIMQAPLCPEGAYCSVNSSDSGLQRLFLRLLHSAKYCSQGRVCPLLLHQLLVRPHRGPTLCYMVQSTDSWPRTWFQLACLWLFVIDLPLAGYKRAHLYYCAHSQLEVLISDELRIHSSVQAIVSVYIPQAVTEYLHTYLEQNSVPTHPPPQPPCTLVSNSERA